MSAKNKNESLLFASTSANLYNFLGHTDVTSHLDIFKKVVQMAYKAHQDLLDFKVDNLVVVDDAQILSSMKTQPPIFVTFHTGSYNMLIAYLLKYGYRFYALSDTESLEIEDYNNVTSWYNQRYSNSGQFAKIDIEQPGSIFNIMKRIKEGYPTLAFLDGNKGIGGQTKTNENLLNINFFKGCVRVRKGLATISFLTKRPLVLALSYMERDQPHLRFFEPIEPNSSDKEAYCHYAIQHIFSYFESHIVNHIDQWCNWPYVHNWSDLEGFKKRAQIPESPTSEFKSWNFNVQRFCPIKFDDKNYLFDRILYSLIPIEPQLTPLFSYKTTAEQRTLLIEHFLREQLTTANDFISKSIFV